MNPSFSFRFMQGRGKESGHIRTLGNAVHITCRGLMPHLLCTLYCLGKPVSSLKTDLSGGLSLSCPHDGFFFLCDENQRLLLWEGEEAGYFRALSLLPKKQPPTPQETRSPEPPPEVVTSAAAPPSAELENSEFIPAPPPHASAPPAASLPALSWPSGMQQLADEMAKGAPFVPFALPGFRCRKCSSASPAVPFTVLGYQTKGSRITALFFAVPGNPLRPPVPLPGYRFREGYWYHIQRIG
ncbi:MAG: hypothetical protein IJB69_04740 [Clostridia bacterium]|nr:hypothetical protein [Clostridia bacterium]